MSIVFKPRQIPVLRTSREAPERKHICHLSLGLSTGGLERLLVDFAKFHDRSRYRLSFVALREVGQPGFEIRELGCDVHGLRGQGLGRLALLQRLTNWLRSEKVDLLHTHNAFPHLYGTLAAWRAKVPAVVHTRHGQRFGHGWRSSLEFRLASWGVDRIIAVSDDAARLCIEEDHVSPQKVQRIWNGIDLSRFAFHGPVRKPHAISVARLSPEKDFPTLLRAVPHVIAQYPEFQLQIVGQGPEMPRLQQLRSELGLEAHVHLLGERRDVPELLQTAGFFVSSSLTEGVSLTLLEAMAIGLPVLATSVGGNPEVVEDGVTGRLVPAGDPRVLANGMIRMLQERSLWPMQAEAARQRVEKYFDAQVMLQQYEALYDELLNKSSPKGQGTQKRSASISAS